MHPEAFPARGDQARPPQVRKMARGLGLRNLQGVVNVAHAHVPGHQEAQDAQPRRIGERLEHVFELAELIRLRRFGVTGLSYIRLDKYIAAPIGCQYSH